MLQHYCHECSVLNGLVIPASPSSLTGTSYQLEKYIKHTAPTGIYEGLNSVFDDPTYEAYSGYTVTGTASGLLEIDYKNRKNLIWYAGSPTGVEYRNGIFTAPTTGVKIVLPEDGGKIHAFPITASPHSVAKCLLCGKPLPLW